MQSLNKSQRKSAYTYVRTRIKRGNNTDEYGKVGTCDMLWDWLVEKGPDFAYPNRKSNHLSWFPEILEEEPTIKKHKPFWWDPDDNEIRLEVLDRCLEKLS